MARRWLVTTLFLAGLLAGCGGNAPAQDSGNAATPSAVAQATQGPLADTLATTYIFAPAQTTASFTVDEVLLGKPNTVVGKTQDVQGSFTLDPSKPQQAVYQPFIVNAESLVTDDNRRNGAIQRFILETGQAANQKITFKVASVDGLPDSVETGTAYDVTITGDLTIHGITKQAVFTGQVTEVDANHIQGSFSATVQRSDYNLVIPQVPMVADVGEQVILKLDFVAEAT